MNGKSNRISSRSPYKPIYELTRGNAVESIHYGAIAVVDAAGNLYAWYGNPEGVTYLRSTAKPFQAIPFFERGGPAVFGLDMAEKAILCASHSGTDEHVAAIRSIQKKVGFGEEDLLCGTHMPYDQATARRMRENKEKITPNRHNCSGKHSGMLAYLHLKQILGEALPENLDYIDPKHPIQKEILSVFAEMCGVAEKQIGLGIDGCSAPVFAVPLYNAAWAYARLCDPKAGGVQPHQRAAACLEISEAMRAHPEMVAGPGRFDTSLMHTANGRIVSKGGAEAFQGMGLLPGALGPGSPALGIALKISDGDDRRQVCAAVSLEVLRQLGALTEAELGQLAEFGPTHIIRNWRDIPVGRAYPVFQLRHSNSTDNVE